MKRKGAASSDDVRHTFLKSLGPLALQELLSIFNASFHLVDCPRIWRVAIIIPLLKAGKSPSDVAPFRPVSLTSCIIKLLGWNITNRLNYIAKSNNLFSLFQAGFCKGRSCEDQKLWIVQAIEDGSQQQPLQCSVLALLDFSKACDTIWWEKLLLCISEAGIPLTFIHCLRFFLTDRRAHVQLHNICSYSCRFNQGLPQGSVLAPLLPLFDINNLAKNLSNNAVIALFADNVSIHTTIHKKEDAVVDSSVRSHWSLWMEPNVET